MKVINYGKQFLDRNDYISVEKTLKTDFLTQGPLVEKFEKKLKEKFGSKYCSVVSNGTAALHLLGKALGWKKGDVILTTPMSFVATTNCVLYSNAKPIFVDIDRNTGNICTKELKKKINLLKNTKTKIKAIIVTDYGGYPSNWPQIKKIAKIDKITLINDSCHSIGSSINGNHKYAIKYADFVTFSFHPVKTITTGEGGAVLTNKKKIDKKIKLLRSHGIIKDKSKNFWEYKINELGYNYRLSDINCSLGISQLKKINKFVNKRRKIAKKYDLAFKDMKNIETLKYKKKYQSSYHLYPLKINFNKTKLNKNLFFKKLFLKKIKLQVHYIPIYRFSLYKKKFKINLKEFPNTEDFYKKIISLPIFFSLSNQSQNKIINTIKSII